MSPLASKHQFGDKRVNPNNGNKKWLNCQVENNTNFILKIIKSWQGLSNRGEAVDWLAAEFREEAIKRLIGEMLGIEDPALIMEAFDQMIVTSPIDNLHLQILEGE